MIEVIATPKWSLSCRPHRSLSRLVCWDSNLCSDIQVDVCSYCKPNSWPPTWLAKGVKCQVSILSGVCLSKSLLDKYDALKVSVTADITESTNVIERMPCIVSTLLQNYTRTCNLCRNTLELAHSEKSLSTDSKCKSGAQHITCSLLICTLRITYCL